MLIHNSPMFTIYFGNAKDALPKSIEAFKNKHNLLLDEPFNRLQKIMPVQTLIFLHQTHSNDGIIINEHNAASIKPFAQEGDYLATQLQHMGLGILTADCLPIVFYDTRNAAMCIAHAGWKGSALGVAQTALERMQKEFATNLDHIKIYFGPSAKPCCYEVNESFKTEFDAYPFSNHAFIEQKNKLFFDLPGFNRMLLESLGVQKQAFRFQYNVCTMCDENYFSHRRQGHDAGRQMTVVCLK